ncbi:unnamed protein product [Ilex paraguariensis]|uniref:Protein kinase domain-containing protein n=1 Tax=Ilex paraguariensis TaxID=185542 RepID=A0ABC8S558_9AQUA
MNCNERSKLESRILGTEMAESSTENSKAEGLVFFGNVVSGFGLHELLSSDAEILGKGTFGKSYKANLEGRDAVVVKRLRVVCPDREFAEKAEELGRMVHENLLPIRGYCWNRKERLILFDYMPMRSLSFLLHGDGGAAKTPLSWEVRGSIAYGVARGIEYLHARGPNVCHGNLKSSNIFLTDNYDVRLSDFGIAQLVSPYHNVSLMAGYRAPEVTNAQEVSQKADVYSFGVLLLELLTGTPPIDSLSRNTGVDLPNFVRSMFQQKPIIDLFDYKLLRNENIGEQMVQMLQLAICCTFQYTHKRPSIAAVTNRIKEIFRFIP